MTAMTASSVAVTGPGDKPQVAWPDTHDGDVARRWLQPLLRHGTGLFVENVHAEVGVVVAGPTVCPYTLCKPGGRNSYVVSPESHYLGYARDELRKLGPGLQLAGRSLLSPLSALLRRCGFDGAVYANNWLLSTNLYPADAARHAPAVLAALVERHPAAPVVFRSVDASYNRTLLGTLCAAGCTPVFSRRVLLQDPEDPGVWRRKQVRRDRNLLANSPYQVVELHARDLVHARDLYRQLYLGKYSTLNPDFTLRFFEHTFAQGLLTYRGLRRGDRLDAVLGFYLRNGVMTAPICGYDLTLDRRLGLYRLLAMLTTIEARERGVVVNDSAGVGQFKRLRGARPVREYNLVYDAHLPRHRRLPWAMLRGLLNGVAVPIIERHDL